MDGLFKKSMLSQKRVVPQRKKPVDKKTKAVSITGMSEEKIDLLKRTICKDSTNDELTLFIHVCNKCGLDPFMKQIYAVKRKGVMTIQTSIDGLRLVADRSGNYAPGREATYVYDDKGQIVSATSYLKKRTSDGMWHEVSATAFFAEFKPSYENNFWKQFPHVMLAKCAESAALRKAFPAEMSGIYTDDEMEQAPPVEETLTLEQCEEVFELVGEDKELMDRILKGYKVSKLGEIKAKSYVALINHLKKNREAIA